MIKSACPIWRPDEIAECLNLSTALYKRLWNEILPEYNKRADYPDPYPGEYVEQDVHYWDLLTDAERIEINNAYTTEWGEFYK